MMQQDDNDNSIAYSDDENIEDERGRDRFNDTYHNFDDYNDLDRGPLETRDAYDSEDDEKQRSAAKKLPQSVSVFE